MESLLIDHSRRRIGKVALRTGQADRDPARHDQDEEAERAPRGGLVHAGESRSGKRCCVLSQVSGLPTSDRRYRNTARRAAIIAMMFAISVRGIAPSPKEIGRASCRERVCQYV